MAGCERKASGAGEWVYKHVRSETRRLETRTRGGEQVGRDMAPVGVEGDTSSTLGTKNVVTGTGKTEKDAMGEGRVRNTVVGREIQNFSLGVCS